METKKLDDLFIEKFSEKYKLTERGIKQAFSKFDKSKDGLLDIDELFILAKNLLNGIKIEDIRKLVKVYDINQDGKISFEEFSDMLINRKNQAYPAGDDDDDDGNFIRSPLSVPARAGNKPVTAWEDRSESSRHIPSEQSSTDDARLAYDTDRLELTSARSAATSDTYISVNDPYAIESRAQLFLKSLRVFLLKKARVMREEGKVTVQQRLGMHHNELMETISRELLARAFRGYTYMDGRQVSQTQSMKRADYCVARADFSRVLRGFVIPGSSSPQTVVIDFIFLLCCAPDLQKGADKLASPSVLADKVFPLSVPPPPPVPSDDVPGGTIKNGAKLETGPRQVVGRGPVVNKDSILPLAVSDLPLKFISRKSRTSLSVPGTIDSAALNRSNQLPPYACVRDHVFGFSSSRQGSSSIFSVCSGMPSSDKDDCLIYTSAAVGIIHDLKTNTQAFFDQHTDDITSMAICRPAQLVATGQCCSVADKSPTVLVWAYDFSSRAGCETALISTIGKGFFQRLVVAIAFSPTADFLVAISGDDHHSMGIFDVRSGAVISTAGCQNGVPPQIRGLVWAPGQTNTEWISRESVGPKHLLCTAGERHLKFWSFSALSKGVQDAALPSCGAKIGKMNATMPKIYLCADFISCDGGKSFDLVSGGSNGSAYLWRQGSLIATAQVCRGYLTCLQVVGAKVFCGGVGGVMKVLDGRTLATLKSFNVADSVTGDLGYDRSAAAASRPMSRGFSAGARPRAASTGPSPASSSASRGGDSLPKGTDVSITGLAVAEDRRSVRGLRLSVYVATSAGTVVRVDVDEPAAVDIHAHVLYFHPGTVNGVASFVNRGDNYLSVATCGDDKLLCIWDTSSMLLTSRYKLQSAAICCDVNPTGTVISVGLSSGGICLVNIESASDGALRLSEGALRKDSKEAASDVKFSPSGECLAVGSHDNFVYVYGCVNSTPPDKKGDRGEIIRAKKQFSLRPLHKLRGHSSYITHLDWSRDDGLLRSTCGAYELLLWDLSSGRIASGVSEADVKWQTHTCVLGFSVMGIWPKYSDGTDVNAISVSKKKNLIATADDFGYLSIFNFPCVVSGAPKRTYNGHSSHVSNVCFNGTYDEQLVTVGGQDCSVMVWRVVPTNSTSNV